jgi:hypothetical protein
MKQERLKRVEERKFKRIAIRFGLEKPEHRAMGIQISSRGMFIVTNHPIYFTGSKLIIEIQTSNGSFSVEAIVRHSMKVPPQMVQHARPGMGVEFIEAPTELRDYLASL